MRCTLTLLKMLKSKKGISPILATLLLVVIAVAAIIVTYAWVMTYMGTQTTSAGTMLDYDTLTWYSNRTIIVVRNTGTSDAKVVRLAIGLSSQNLTDVTLNTNIGTGIVIQTGHVASIILDWPNGLATTWQSTQRYYFRIAPNVGNALTFSWNGP
jgi:flagellin-like protein